ncbi:MAG: COX15/CtaA family protein [Cytophagales bacterium]|nr:COX15/CtaA family protein [Cytophagales bacterium]
MNISKDHMGFKRLSLTTLIAVYFLILVGGIVRSTGSGMGCPDWPKCFGSYIPPTDVSELPEDYKAYYAEYRHQKNIRFARYLEFFGFSNKADQIVNDASILVEGDFNVYKTWTEYVNRLIGVIIGLLIFATLLGSITYLKEDKTVFYVSLLTFVTVGFQGWIGSIVVSTNLMPWMITIHMILALVIVLLLIYINFRIRRNSIGNASGPHLKLIFYLTVFCLITMAVQIVLGTQVREAIDRAATELSFALRETWISRTGLSFMLHRSFSLFILGLHGLLLYSILKSKQQATFVRNIGKYVVLLILLEIISGMVMAYFGMPPFVQPVHLLLSTLIFGVLYYMYLVIIYSKNKIATS